MPQEKRFGDTPANSRRLPMPSVDALMRTAVHNGVFPGGVVLVSRNDRICFFEAYGVVNLKTRQPVCRETLYDLASLTKPLATSLAVMQLVASEGLNLDQPLGDILPFFRRGDKAALTIKQLLHHTAGLPAHRPYYLKAMQLPASERRSEIRNWLRREALLYPPGHRVLYSDLGFMILEWIVEHVVGQRLDRFVSERIYSPLGLQKLFFVDLAGLRPEGRYAATEQCPWRGRLLEGEVHDDNAFAMGGIAGHAGLFGSAGDIHRLLSALLGAYHGGSAASVFRTGHVRQFFARLAGTDKALGFDMPAATNSSCGSHFSPDSVGHLGFTGTSFWIDPEKHIIVILLTNRVHPSRSNEAIRAFRPVLHDAVMQTLATSASTTSRTADDSAGTPSSL